MWGQRGAAGCYLEANGLGFRFSSLLLWLLGCPLLPNVESQAPRSLLRGPVITVWLDSANLPKHLPLKKHAAKQNMANSVRRVKGHLSANGK